MLLSGVAGATVLTAAHETLRHMHNLAPRMDLMGMQALRRILFRTGAPQPGPRRLFWYTLAGDFVSNALFYSLGGLKVRHSLLRGTLLGFSAGLGALLLPGPLGLNTHASRRTTATALMTMGLYTLGGLTAGLARKLMARWRQPRVSKHKLVL